MPIHEVRLLLRLLNNPKLLTVGFLLLVIQIITPYVFLWAIVSSYGPEMNGKLDTVVNNTHDIKSMLTMRRD